MFSERVGDQVLLCCSILQHNIGNKLSFIRSRLAQCRGMTAVVKKNSGIRQDERIKPAPHQTPLDPFVDFVGMLFAYTIRMYCMYKYISVCVQFLMFWITFWWLLRGGSIAVSKLSYNKNTPAKCLLGYCEFHLTDRGWLQRIILRVLCLWKSMWLLNTIVLVPDSLLRSTTVRFSFLHTKRRHKYTLK